MNSLKNTIASLQKMFAGVRTDAYGKFFDKTETEPKRYLATHSPVTEAVLEAHIAGKQPIGQYLMLAGAYTSTVAAFDVDDHAGTVAWDEMLRHTKNLCTGLKRRGMKPLAFRSGGGKGTHIFCVWQEPQDAASIIALFSEILAEYGLKKGEEGIDKGTVEIFPKQTSVPQDGTGNLIAVPLARQSVALSDGGFEVLPKEQFCFTEAHYSPAIQHATPDRNTLRETSKIRAGYDVVRGALNVIPADDYSLWIRILLCLKGAVEADILTEEQGEKLYSEWSVRSEKHNPQRDDALWQRMRPTGDLTLGTLFWCAKEHGWVAPATYTSTPAEIEWEEPIDFRRSATKIAEFPADFLPGEFGSYANDIAYRMSVQREFTAIPLLIAFATILGRDVVLQPKQNDETWVERACLWGMVISEPGTRKSPSMKAAISPLSDIQKGYDAQYKKEKEIYDIAFAEHKKNGGSAPVKPKHKKIIVNDVTVEGLSVVISENPNGILLLRDELASFLLSMDQYKGGKGGDRGFFLECWGGGSWSSTRKTVQSISISDLYLNIYGTIQPEVARKLFAYTSDGLTARFGLMAYPDHQLRDFIDEAHDLKAEEAMQEKFDSILRLFYTNPKKSKGDDDEKM